MTEELLREIEALSDSTVPYYVPSLITEVRRLRAELHAAQANRTCETCAKWSYPESAGKRWCDQLDMFRPASFGCVEWRQAHPTPAQEGR